MSDLPHQHSSPHTLNMGNQVLQFQLQRTARRSIGLKINAHGLTLTAPFHTSIAEIERIVASKSAWIFNKLQIFKERAAQKQMHQMRWQSGEQIHLFGQALQLCIRPNTEHVSCKPKQFHIESDTTQLQCFAPANASTAQLAKAVQNWMQAIAIQHFTQRLNFFAPQLQVHWTQLRLSNAKTRWGSANSNGHIQLHWRLVQMPLHLIDYVVVHELSHLKHMNHSPEFWAVVAQILPKFKEYRTELKHHTLPTWL